jgi:type I restriction enzyme M protein
MIAIRSNFFYTRSVPCELWFLDKAKPKEHRDKVLMVDARNIYRQVTRKIYDFSPEQLKNISSIVWLYRGESDRFLALVSDHLRRSLDEAYGCFEARIDDEETVHPLPDFTTALTALTEKLAPFIKTQRKDAAHAEAWREFQEGSAAFTADTETFQKTIEKELEAWEKTKEAADALGKAAERIHPIAETSRDLVKDVDHLYKLVTRVIDTCEKELNAGESEHWVGREVTKGRKALDDARQIAVEQLKRVRYFHRHAHWLLERFPKAELRDVEGLVKLVSIKEIAKNDWSLTPGRYVGVAPEEEDEDFDFEQTINDIHAELKDLNAEAVELAAMIARNFEGLRV